MNYDILDKLIPARRLPFDHAAPRARLFELLRDLAELREAEQTPDTQRQIRSYERILEQ
jgi:hypothetical protein